MRILVVGAGAIAEYVVSKSRGVAGTRLYPIGAVTRGQLGKELAEFGEMQVAGAVAVSDDGHWLSDGALLRHAFEHASLFGMPVIQHGAFPSACSRKASSTAAMHASGVNRRSTSFRDRSSVPVGSDGVLRSMVIPRGARSRS